jgi:hypothetical protein
MGRAIENVMNPGRQQHAARVAIPLLLSLKLALPLAPSSSSSSSSSSSGAAAAALSVDFLLAIYQMRLI